MVDEQILDKVFGALSHGVRRQTIEALRAGPQTASELAAPHGMSLAGFMKHLRVLTDAGLVTCMKDGRKLVCKLAAGRLAAASDWLADRERIINARLEALGRDLRHRETAEAPSARDVPRQRSTG